MKQDVLDALSGRYPHKIPSKETLNHRGIIEYLSGIDVYENTPAAFDIAWRKLGIDIHTPLMKENAPPPRVPGGTWEEDGRIYSDYGVYPTSMPLALAGDPAAQAEDRVFNYDTRQDDFGLDEAIRSLRIQNREFRAHFQDLAVMYELYYTTLFMWPVVTFDWIPFMLAAAADPQRFDELLWQPWARISRKHFEALAAIDEEVVFCHDDLAMGDGPVFSPAYLEKYIFSRYEWIMEPVFRAGKKLIFVSDGNIDRLLERLLEFPIAGIMYENPATSFERVLETWGKAGRGFIGGISTSILTNGTSEEVSRHTRQVIKQGRQYPGFIISSCGGLPGTIPLDNMLAYIQTRNELGCLADLQPANTRQIESQK
ncbi:MAG: uroporphyrinogen decarboxylase family protein [Omnitrophica WOR_2 bacterium]